MQLLQRCCASLQALRATLHHPAAYYSVQVLVPSLGESITDGTICAVLKSAGENVKENETIAQIETDKVTIDIKAPTDGTILGVVVQEQDTVVPGQLVATVDDAAAKANLIGATPPASASQSAAAEPAAAAAAQPAAAPAGPAHRVPSIRFPPRMTADGQRISLLPAAEQTAILRDWKTSNTAPATHASPALPAAAAAAPSAATIAAAAAKPVSPGGAAAQPAASPATPSKFATSVTRLDHMPARRELTDKEMELIELGGAAP